MVSVAGIIMNFTPDVESDFGHCKKAHLNNAAISVMPSQSMDAMRGFAETYCALGPDSAESDAFLHAMVRRVREAAAKILSCRPEEISLSQSTTDGINLVAGRLRLGDTPNIIIRGMGHEHHSNLYPWLQLRGKAEIKSLPIDCDGFFKLDDLEGFLDGDTSLVALSHALYNTGAILPLKEIGHTIAKRAPFFVDAAQSVGCVGEMDVSKFGCDFMAFNGSKWLCGPLGTGLFYSGRDAGRNLVPGEVGGESAELHGQDLSFKDPPERFETGFRNYAGMAGLEASMAYLARIGLSNIRKKNKELAGLLRDGLARIPGAVLYGPEDPELRTSIVSFNIGGHDPDRLVAMLARRGIIVAVREIGELKMVRASPHFFNTESQIMQLVGALKGL